MSEPKHIPGPWMAAAAPSSVVGWPVVGPGGRSICSVSYLAHAATKDGSAPYKAEVGATAKLIAAAPDLLAELREAATIFRRYEQLHREKGTVDGELKANANADRAARIEAAIAKATSAE